MILFFLDFLGHFFKVPTVFSYSSTRMLLAALTTLLISIFLGPRVIKKLYELKTGQSIRVEDCPLLAQLHEKKKDTLTMGGILILGSVVIAQLLWGDLLSSFTWVLLAATVWLGGVGAVDDYLKLKYKNSKGLSGKKKLAMQLLLSLLFALYMIWTQENVGVYFIPFFKDPVFILTGGALALSVFFTMFVVTGSSNAVNLTDGLDGLAAGCVAMVALVFGVLAFLSNNSELAKYLNILHIEGSGEIAIFMCGLVGACLGFLWYNGYPAQVFMGDTGSLALGGILGVVAVLLRRELLLGIVGGIFVMEAMSVIMQVASYKLRNKKRVFLCAPLHHHYEYKGWPETKVVMRFWIISLILALAGLASLKFQ